MTAPTPSKQYAIACPTPCGLHPDKIGPENAKKLLDLKVQGMGSPRFTAAASKILGRELQRGAVSRHLRHYRELVGPLEQPTDESGNERRASDVEILDAVIQSAWKNRAHWRPSLRDMLEAMAKKHSITGGSEATDLMRLFDEADGPEEDVPAETEALLSPDERPTDDADDLSSDG